MKATWGILFIALLIAALPVHGQACGVATAAGILPDADCDAIPDSLDNCPRQANVQQEDLNRNGIGDACDALIEEVLVEPDNRLKQGDVAHLVVRVYNNRQGPITDITIAAESTQLKVKDVKTLSELPAGESASVELWLQVPACAATGRNSIAITSAFREPITRAQAVETQYIVLTIEKGDRCTRTPGPLDSTIINVFGKVDLDRGEDAIIPITITNMDAQQAGYHLSVQDLGTWGTWRIDPHADIMVPGGHQATAYLYVQTGMTTPPGTQKLTLTVTSDGQQTRIPIELSVRAPVANGWAIGGLILQALLVLILMVIIGAIILLLVLHMNKRHTPKEEKQAPKNAEKTAKRAAPRKRVAIEDAPRRTRETYY